MRTAVIRGVAALAMLAVASPVWADDEEDVAAAMAMWGDYLAKGTTEEPGEILSLYAEDGVLWGTLSSKRRDDPAAIRDYFVAAYRALPELSVTFKDPHIRIYGDTAVNTGYYTFSFEKDGQTQTLPARYSFTLVNDEGKWLIVDHHSSAMPAPGPASRLAGPQPEDEGLRGQMLVGGVIGPSGRARRAGRRR